MKKIAALLIASMMLASPSTTSALAIESSQSQSAIIITSQPKDYVGNGNEKFTWIISCDTANVTYQWQYLENGKTTWVNFKGETGASLTKFISESWNGWKIRCVVTDVNGNAVNSQEANITIITGPTIISQPNDYIGNGNEKFTWTISCNTANVTYQWQYLENGKTTWVNFKGETGASLTKFISESWNGWKIRCVVTDVDGNAVNSQEANITIITGPTIISQPNDYIGNGNEKFTWTISCDTANVTYQWQYLENGKTTWVNFKGETGASLTKFISESWNGWKIRCVVTDVDGNAVNSQEANITIITGPTIISQPNDYIGNGNEKFTWTISCDTANVTYQWQYLENGKTTWVNFKGETGASLTKFISESWNGWKIRCVVTDTKGDTVNSQDAAIILVSPITIISPDSVTIAPTDVSTFSVTAIGDGLTYAWEQNTDGENWTPYTGDGADTSSITVNGADAISGTQYRCVVTDKYGQKAISEPATLTILANMCGPELTYSYDNGTLIISGTGYFYDVAGTQISPFQSIADENNGVIENVIVEDGVDGIGAFAFNNIQINNITLPESVKLIGKQAFNNTGDTTMTVYYPALIFSNDSGLGYGDSIIGYEKSSAYDFANANGLSFTAMEDEFDRDDNELYLYPGETVKLNVTGTRLRYHSTNENVATVDSEGNVTIVGNNSDYAVIYVYDVRGRSQMYNIHVVENDFDFPLYEILYPGHSFELPDKGIMYTSVQDNPNAIEKNWWDFRSFTAKWAATDEIFSYAEDGRTAITYVNATIDVIDAKNHVEYSGSVEKDGANVGGVWYAVSAGDVDTKVNLNISSGTELLIHVYRSFTTGDFWNEETQQMEGSHIDGNGGYNIKDWSITVPANQTYYLWVMPNDENGRGTYTLKADYVNYEYPSLFENEEYTIIPSMSGELTTLSFTASSDETYLLESSSNKYFHFVYSLDENFEERFAENWIGDDHVSYYHYPLAAGQTIYLRYWFDEETVEDEDYINVRIVPAPRHSVSVNENETYTIPLNPEENTVIEFTPDEPGEYYFYSLGDPHHVLIFDSEWNQVNNYWGYDTSCILSWTVETPQTYYIQFHPTSIDKEGNVQLVLRRANQAYDTEFITDVNKWGHNEIPDVENPAVYTVEHTDEKSFTVSVEKTGAENYYTQVYYGNFGVYEGAVYRLKFTVSADTYMEDAFQVMLQQSHDPYDIWSPRAITVSSEPTTYILYIRDTATEGFAKLLFDGFKPGKYTFSDISLVRIDPDDVKVNIQTIELDNEMSGYYSQYGYDVFRFTAPEDGTYIFTSIQNDGLDMYGELYDSEDMSNQIAYDDDSADNMQFQIRYTLNAGQTVYLKSRCFNSDDSSTYSVTVTKEKSDNNYENNVIDTLYAEPIDAASEHGYMINEYEAIFRIAGMSGPSRTLSIANSDGRDMSIWFLSENGEGGCVGDTFNDTIFIYEFGSDFIGDGSYIYVKLVTDDYPIGHVILNYFYMNGNSGNNPGNNPGGNVDAVTVLGSITDGEDKTICFQLTTEAWFTMDIFEWMTDLGLDTDTDVTFTIYDRDTFEELASWSTSWYTIYADTNYYYLKVTSNDGTPFDHLDVRCYAAPMG